MFMVAYSSKRRTSVRMFAWLKNRAATSSAEQRRRVAAMLDQFAEGRPA
jgi:hypothetical protein